MISEEVAYDAATSRHDFKLMLEAKGRRASDVEQVLGDDTPGGDPGGVPGQPDLAPTAYS
jgi:hypothetical protein